MSAMGLTISRVARLAWRPVRTFLADSRVNPTVSRLLRPLAPRLPTWFLLFIPVVRTVSVASPVSGRTILLANPGGRDPIASLLFWRGLDGWEPETTDVFLRLARPESLVLDVGANTGLFTLLAADLGSSIQVHAFEPVPSVFALLCDNIVLNSFDNVSAHEVALVEDGATVELYVPEGHVPVMASVKPGWSGRREDVTTVNASTVDDFAASVAPSKISLMKIDVEGAEYSILQGASKTIVDHQPFIICEILSQTADSREAFTFLEESNYLCFHLTADGPQAMNSRPEANSNYKNYLFIPIARLEEAECLLRTALSGTE